MDGGGGEGGVKRGGSEDRLLPGAALLALTWFSWLADPPGFVLSALRGAMGFVFSKAMNDSLKGQQEFMRLQVTEAGGGAGKVTRGSLPARGRAGLAAAPAGLCSPPGVKGAPFACSASSWVWLPGYRCVKHLFSESKNFLNTLS